MDSDNYEKLHDALPQIKFKTIDSTHNIALVNPEELAKTVGEVN